MSVDRALMRLLFVRRQNIDKGCCVRGQNIERGYYVSVDGALSTLLSIR